MSGVVVCSEDTQAYSLGTCLLVTLAGAELSLLEHVDLRYSPGHSTCTLSRLAEGGLPLMHSPDCPCLAYYRSEGHMLQKQRPLKLCACGVVESGDGRLLLTRRDPRMKYFSKAWVFPGGHVEQGESVETAVLREIREETGLPLEIQNQCAYLGAETCECRPFLLYESVFPSLLEAGLPQSQNLIVFFHIKLRQNASDLRVLNSPEVDISVWLTQAEMQQVWASESGQVPGVFRDSASGEVRFEQLWGNSPNALGEGVGRAHSLALQFLLSHT